MIARLRRRCAEEAGFTLIELLVSLVLGLVLLGATLGILDVSLHQTARIDDRVNSAQLGRTAMEKITQELHSSCVAAGSVPIQAGSDATHLNLVSAFSSQPTVTPTLHKITFAAGTLTDAAYPVASGVAPSWTFATLPATTTVLLDNVSQTSSGSPPVATPVFQYFAFVNGVLSSTALPVPLSAANAALAAQVNVAYTAGPSGGNTTPDRSTDFADSVVLRLSPASGDPTASNLPCE